MNINSSPFSKGAVVEVNDGEIENGNLAVEFIMRACKAVEDQMIEGKQEIEFSLASPGEDVTSQYNMRANGNTYSLRVQKWNGTFKRMDHELENTSVLVRQGNIEIIEQDFTIEMEEYLEEEGFDVEVTDEDIVGEEAEEAKQFLEDKFGMT